MQSDSCERSFISHTVHYILTKFTFFLSWEFCVSYMCVLSLPETIVYALSVTAETLVLKPMYAHIHVLA